MRAVDDLIRRVPNYAYFHELKGQILLEAGKPREAIGPLRQAVGLAPAPASSASCSARRELATGDAGQLGDAVANLRAGLAEEPLAAIGYRHLAMAYQHAGQGRGGRACHGGRRIL